MVKKFIEKNSGAIFIAALLLGIFLPTNLQDISKLLIPLVVLMLYISFLNVDLSHVKSELKNPHQLLIQIVWNFILVPIILFLIINQLGFPQFAIAAMLLAAMPAGLGSPVLTNIADGKIGTSVVLTVATHILVPLSVPLLFWLFTGLGIQIEIFSLAKQIFLLIGIPLVLAWISRKFLKKTVENTKKYHKITAILVLATVAYLAIVPYSETIRNDFFSIIPILIGLYFLYIVFCITSFIMSRKRKLDEQAAIIISRIYMNNTLAIVLAFQFFGPKVALITVLAEIPWFTTFGAYLWFQKKFIKLK